MSFSFEAKNELCRLPVQLCRNADIECPAKCLLRLLSYLFAKFKIVIHRCTKFFLDLFCVFRIKVHQIINSQDLPIEDLVVCRIFRPCRIPLIA